MHLAKSPCVYILPLLVASKLVKNIFGYCVQYRQSDHDIHLAIR